MARGRMFKEQAEASALVGAFDRPRAGIRRLTPPLSWLLLAPLLLAAGDMDDSKASLATGRILVSASGDAVNPSGVCAYIVLEDQADGTTRHTLMCDRLAAEGPTRLFSVSLPEAGPSPVTGSDWIAVGTVSGKVVIYDRQGKVRSTWRIPGNDGVLAFLQRFDHGDGLLVTVTKWNASKRQFQREFIALDLTEPGTPRVRKSWLSPILGPVVWGVLPDQTLVIRSPDGRYAFCDMSNNGEREKGETSVPTTTDSAK